MRIAVDDKIEIIIKTEDTEISGRGICTGKEYEASPVPMTKIRQALTGFEWSLSLNCRYPSGAKEKFRVEGYTDLTQEDRKWKRR